MPLAWSCENESSFFIAHMWSLDQQHLHHLGRGERCRISGSMPGLLDCKAHNKMPGDIHRLIKVWGTLSSCSLSGITLVPLSEFIRVGFYCPCDHL